MAGLLSYSGLPIARFIPQRAKTGASLKGDARCAVLASPFQGWEASPFPALPSERLHARRPPAMEEGPL